MSELLGFCFIKIFLSLIEPLINRVECVNK